MQYCLKLTPPLHAIIAFGVKLGFEDPPPMSRRTKLFSSLLFLCVNILLP